jgi:hypothetical protein
MSTLRKQVSFSPPDKGLVDLLNGLLKEAADTMHSDDGNLLFPAKDTARGSVEAIRLSMAAGFRKKDWSRWRKGRWPGDQPFSQRRFTDALLAFSKGSLDHPWFATARPKKTVKEVYTFLVAEPKRARRVEDARRGLETYKALIFAVDGSRPALELGAEAALSESRLYEDVNDHENVVIPPAAPIRIDSRIYNGTQREAFHPETRRIVANLAELQRENNHTIPAGLPALEYKVRLNPAASVAVERQKRLLYGGMVDLSLGFTVHDYVAANFAFQRSLSERISNSIINAEDRFTSHTIIARPGQGKSLALAQILARLTSMPGLWTFWSIQNSVSDLAKSVPFRCDEDVQEIENYFRLLERCECFPKRLIFLFDDFSNRPLSDAPAITRFYRWCQEYSEREGRSISLVISANDRRHTLSSEEDTLELKIDEADERRLFTMLTDTKPNPVKKRCSLDEMLAAHFEEKRHIKDDVQSFADFIIRHSDRVDDFTPNWFSDLENESSTSQKVLPAIAVSQLLDLALPEHIAHRIAGLDIGSQISLTDLSRRISRPADDQWGGYVLSSPRQARSLLDRLDKLNEKFLRGIFVDIVGHSLSQAKADLELWKITDEGYVRHLFHRLAKRNYNRLDGLANGPSFANELFVAYGETIIENLRTQFDPDLCARWAGTFSTLSLFGRSGIDRESAERYVYELCRDVVFSRANSVRGPQAFVLLMGSMEALCINFRDEKAVHELAANAEGAINLDAVLVAALDGSDSQWERRANEVLHSYVKFYRSIPNKDIRETRGRILDVYEGAEQTLKRKGVGLDAANYLEMANCVWIYKKNKEYDKDDVELRAHYLRLARHSVLSQFRQQGMWNKKVQSQIREFERQFGRGVEEINEVGAHVEDAIE